MTEFRGTTTTLSTQSEAFARLRRTSAERCAKGIRDYLVLLSISEACNCKGRFSSFHEIWAVDIAAFAQHLTRVKRES
jgi:hypothetical protein